MNWVGGARRRVGLQNEKKTQKEYFERKRQHKKIRAFQSPEKKNGISQDLLALHTVNIAYSGMAFGENAAKTCKNICGVCGDDAVGESTVRRWFAKFKAGEFSLEDDSHSGKPSKLDEDVLKAKIEENSNITTRELAEELEVSKNKKFPEKRYIRKVNIDQSKTFSGEIQEVELPHSPINTPSKLNLEETNVCVISKVMERNEEKDQIEDRVLEPRRSKRQGNVVSYTPKKKHKVVDKPFLESVERFVKTNRPRNAKLTGINKSSNGKETSSENRGKKGHNDALLSQPFPSILNFPAMESHQSKSEKLFNTTIQNQTNEMTSLNVLDSHIVDRTKRNLDKYQPSFLPSMDLYPSMSQDLLASPPRHHQALPENRQIPIASISDVYNKRGSKWREHTKSVHTETYIEERQHCWQMATSQRSYISKNTSPFITTLHQLQETRPYRYHQFACPESPEEYIAIPLGSAQQIYMPSAQTERVRKEKEFPANTQDKFTDNLTFQISKQTSDFWQIPVYGDFVKEMKIKQSQVDALMSTDQSTKMETEEDACAKKCSRENLKEKSETPLMTIPKYNEDQEDPVFSEHTSSQMTHESRPCSKLVDVSVQADLKGSVIDASTSPVFWQQNDRVTQCDEEEFKLKPTEEKPKDSLQSISGENRGELLQETAKNSETFYQLRSRSAAKAGSEK